MKDWLNLAPGIIFPLQVMKYTARLSTTPSFLSPSKVREPARRAVRIFKADFTPIPGTRSSISLSARLTSTGKCSRWLTAQLHLGSSSGSREGCSSSSSSLTVKP